jgi:hypothetical protein
VGASRGGALVTTVGDAEIGPLTVELIPSYLRFAREAFGTGSYQSRRGFLRWLYDESPVEGACIGDGKVVVCAGEVVGCYHKMRLPWRFAGRDEVVPSPSNLFLLERNRARGVGFGLISETFANHKHLLLIGSGPAVQPIYDRLGAQLIETHWLRTVVNPLSAPAYLAMHRASTRLADLSFASAHAIAGRLPRVHSSLDNAAAGEVAEMLIRGARGRMHLAWNAELVRWRLFSPIGPRHVLVRIGDRALTVVSLGSARSLFVSRTVEWYAEDDASAHALALATRAVLTALGVNVWLAMTSDDRTASQWRATGFWGMKEPPSVYELHKPRDMAFGAILLNGGGGDSGFEAMPLD